MSIYREGKRWSGMYDVVQPVAQPKRATEAPASSSASTTDWSSMRKTQPVDYLLPKSDEWFDALPPDVAPCALATYFPRIVNLIASNWNDRRSAPKVFEELLFDRRGGRAGFPPAVKRDLQRLQQFWYSTSLSLR